MNLFVVVFRDETISPELMERIKAAELVRDTWELTESTLLMWNVRERDCRELSNVIGDASAMVDNYRVERVVEVQREASRRLKVWLANNCMLPELTLPLEASLVSAIQTAHPSSVRASVRREGLWDNLSYNYQMGFGVQEMVDSVVSDRIKGFREVASNIVDDPTMSEAEGLVNQAARMMEAGREGLRTGSHDFGRTIHTYDMRSDGQLWDSCDSEWEKGQVTGTGSWRTTTFGLANGWMVVMV